MNHARGIRQIEEARAGRNPRAHCEQLGHGRQRSPRIREATETHGLLAGLSEPTRKPLVERARFEPTDAYLIDDVPGTCNPFGHIRGCLDRHVPARDSPTGGRHSLELGRRPADEYELERLIRERRLLCQRFDQLGSGDRAPSEHGDPGAHS